MGRAFLAGNGPPCPRSEGTALEQALAFEMPPILLKPLCWFEQEKPKLYEQLVQPLLNAYEVL